MKAWWLTPAPRKVTSSNGTPRELGEPPRRVLHGVAEADDPRVRRAVRVRLAEHRHRVRVVEEPGVGAQLGHVLPMPSITGIVRSARKMPPIPSVSPIVWRRPWRAGISKSVSVAAWPPTWIMLIAKSAPSRAARRSACARWPAWRRAARRSSAPSPRRCSRRSGSMSCSASLDVAELRESEQVAEQVARELDAAGSDERDPVMPGGGCQIGSRLHELARMLYLFRAETAHRDASFQLCANPRASVEIGLRGRSVGADMVRQEEPMDLDRMREIVAADPARRLDELRRRRARAGGTDKHARASTSGPSARDANGRTGC